LGDIAVTGAGPGTHLRVHARACAAVGVLGGLAHLWLAPGHGWALGAGMVVMAAVCLPCAAGLWQQTGMRAARTMMSAALAMAVLHAVLLLGGSPVHAGHGAPAALVPAGRDGQTSAMLLLTVLELTAAFAAATLISRVRRAGQRLIHQL